MRVIGGTTNDNQYIVTYAYKTDMAVMVDGSKRRILRVGSLP